MPKSYCVCLPLHFFCTAMLANNSIQTNSAMQKHLYTMHCCLPVCQCQWYARKWTSAAFFAHGHQDPCFGHASEDDDDDDAYAEDDVFLPHC